MGVYLSLAKAAPQQQSDNQLRQQASPLESASAAEAAALGHPMGQGRNILPTLSSKAAWTH
ncbi:MAG: hypothetical protein ACRCUB_15520 [Plesiomonas shigelloides]